MSVPGRQRLVREAMKYIGSQLVILATLALTSPSAYSACDTNWARLLPVHQTAETRAFKHTPYRNARAESGDAKSVAAALKQALENGTLDSPEALFGLLDAWNPDPSSNFLAQWRWLGAHGIEATPRNYAFPYGWANANQVEDGGGKPRDPKVKPSLAVFPKVRPWPPFLAKQKYLTLTYPEAAPRTPDELMQLVYGYATALATHRLSVAGRAPLLSLPFGNGPWSYPQRIAQELELAERHIYQNLKLVMDAFPDVAPPLAEKDDVWKKQKLQTAVEAVSNALVPRYSVFRPFKPTKENYEKFLEDLRNQPKPSDFPKLGQAGEKYRTRAALDWTVTRWRDTLVALVSVNFMKTLYGFYDDWKKGKLREQWEEWKHLPEKIEPERLKRAVDHYAEDPNGFDLVNEHYDKAIADLEADIQHKGDADGSRAKKITEMKRSRERLSK